MITIIPNWHPITVHFTIGLLATASLLYLVAFLLPKHWRESAFKVAQWNLSIGAFFAVISLITGFLAYNSVAHDAASHQAMTLHRNWAIATLVIYVIAFLIAVLRSADSKFHKGLLSALLFIGLSCLSVTGYLGGENVYRYGLGVMSLPDTSQQKHDEGHDHSHHDHKH